MGGAEIPYWQTVLSLGLNLWIAPFKFKVSVCKLEEAACPSGQGAELVSRVQILPPANHWICSQLPLVKILGCVL